MTRMRRTQITSLRALVALATTVWLSPELAGQAGQLAASKAPGAREETSLRTPWGNPDLQGIWTNSTSTRFERSDEAGAPSRRADRPDGNYDPNVASVGAYNDFWTERGARERGSSEGKSKQAALVVDPADGKLPPLTPKASKYAEALEAVRRPEQPGTWTELNPYDRCITRGLPGAMFRGSTITITRLCRRRGTSRF